MTITLRLGTRGSSLAVTQSRGVAEALMARRPGLRVELVTITSTGDRQDDRAFASVGTVGMFVREIEQALLENRVDFAVHSYKDLPTEDTPGLAVHAVPGRATPYDVLVSRNGEILDELEPGAVIGTGSPRRKAQILAYRDDVRVSPIRGNIDTRLKKVDSGQCDAVILAAAGLERLGLQDRVAEIFPPEVMIPAVGQGCLALQARADDETTAEILKAIDDRPSHTAALAERSFLKALGGGCHTPIAALARVQGRQIRLTGLVATPDGESMIRDEVSGASPDVLGKRLAKTLRNRGADRLLSRSSDEG